MIEKVEDVMEIISLINDAVNYLISIITKLGPVSGIILIILESIIPVLPLSVFIALNGASFGYFFGFIISWISTCFGCFLSFVLVRRYFKKKFDKYLGKNDVKRVKKIKKRIDKIKFTSLVLVIALPFTPAFAVNIAAGLSNMDIRKFIIAILIGKLSIVYFWTYVGKSLIESMMDLKTIIIVCILLTFAYIVSKIVSKKMNFS